MAKLGGKYSASSRIPGGGENERFWGFLPICESDTKTRNHIDFRSPLSGILSALDLSTSAYPKVKDSQPEHSFNFADRGALPKHADAQERQTPPPYQRTKKGGNAGGRALVLIESAWFLCHIRPVLVHPDKRFRFYFRLPGHSLAKQVVLFILEGTL